MSNLANVRRCRSCVTGVDVVQVTHLQGLVCFVVLLALAGRLSAKHIRANVWAVKLANSSTQVADEVAQSAGFVNLGKVLGCGSYITDASKAGSTEGLFFFRRNATDVLCLVLPYF
jgi:hypothetical protein